MAYTVHVIDRKGYNSSVLVFAVDEITEAIRFMDVSGVVQLFNPLTEWDLQRPVGEVDLLIGIQYAGIHPWRGEEQSTHGHLRLLTSKYKTGFLLGGTHPSISSGLARMENSVFQITRGQPPALVYGSTSARQRRINLTKKVPSLSFLECEEFINRGQQNPLVLKTITAEPHKQINLPNKVSPLTSLQCEELTNRAQQNPLLFKTITD